MSQPPPPPPPPGGQPPPYGYGYGAYPPPPPGYWPAQPQWTPPPIDPRQVRPSRAWFWVAAIPALAGIVLTAFFVVKLVGQFDTGIDRLRTPGSTMVELDAGDERGIYLQTAGAPGSRSASEVTLSCSVRHAEQERSVALRDASGFTLTLNDDEFVEQLRFVAPADGTYVVACHEPSDVPIAIGPHVAVRRFLGPLVGAIASLVIGIALAAVAAIVIAVRRSSHRQRLQREAWDAHQRAVTP